MSVTVTFQCGGCFAKAEGTTFLQREQHASEVAPEGWIAFDPYTGCCYCQDCWAAIEATPKENHND